ncbi:helix-turn-helix transcriptional regulator [Tamlana sp. s12]|uniref:helix-turn-helix domain-containing protein n=1 Tax=Tamlana sp. s12 TaxID=1630406 RepID=UPI000800AD79|nr:AraC family transcriptional regulator [Tamlana sp. s12]OBQ55897.1 AraC family transcriptional regulator [Tamlana sp. s12]QQY83598.1 helix-turn-helix transcriptional regulator [Tamlana sp. s12]
MTFFVKYDFNTLCKTFLETHLNALGISYTLHSINEISIEEELSHEKQAALIDALKKCGVGIETDKKSTLVDRIKNVVDGMLRDSSQTSGTLSTYLSETLHYSYAHLSAVFSESTYTSIENYAILRRVDLVKEYLCNTDLTLTEIAFKLEYSSVAHLSGQFKKTTGLTPSAFKRIMNKKQTQNT